MVKPKLEAKLNRRDRDPICFQLFNFGVFISARPVQEEKKQTGNCEYLFPASNNAGFIKDKHVFNTTISKIIIKDVKGVNKDSNAVKFFKVVEIEDRWPITDYNGRLSDSSKIHLLSVKDFTSLEEFLKFGKNNGLSHLIIDNQNNMPDFFINIFYN